MTEEATKAIEEKKDRSHREDYVKKKGVPVKICLKNGSYCIGLCHVLWPDGRTSDVLNDERPFIVVTNASLEGDSTSYDLISINKDHIQFLLEFKEDRSK